MIKFDSENGSPDPQKSLKFIGFYCVFWILAFLKIRSIFDAILVPTWLHSGRILDVPGVSGRLLGRLGGFLGLLGGLLGRLKADTKMESQVDRLLKAARGSRKAALGPPKADLPHPAGRSST